MMELSDGSRLKRLGAAVLVITTLATGLSGCGWTPRDEYLAHRRVSVAPQTGDGSRMLSRLPDDPFRAQAGHATAMANEGMVR